MRKKRIWIMAILCLTLIVACAYGVCLNSKEEKTVEQVRKPEKEEALKFLKKYERIKAGKSKIFRVNNKKAIWKSSNKTVATVSKNGEVTGIRYGNTVITAKVGKKIVKTKLVVEPKHIIGIDPGHQLRQNGELEPNGPGASVMKPKVTGGTFGAASHVSESSLMLKVSRKLKEELIKRGYKVVMTRTKQNVNISNSERALMLNKECDIAVRLHADGLENAAVKGASMQCSSASNPYIGKLYRKCEKLSRCILEKYCHKTRRVNRGIAYRDDLTGSNYSTIPVTLIEMGFMTNASEDRYMTSETGQEEMSIGIADGIDSYFGYNK